MRFERVRPGEYRAQYRGGTYIWVVRSSRTKWVWFIGGYTGGNTWETDDNGPFPTKKLAIADAIANYQAFVD
jgi:hypothetical protein